MYLFAQNTEREIFFDFIVTGYQPLTNKISSSQNIFIQQSVSFQPNTSFPGPARSSCWGDFNKGLVLDFDLP